MQVKLQSLIQATEDLNILIEEDNYDVSLSQDMNRDPSPVARMNTSSTRTNPDVLNINGWIRELNCAGAILDTTDYLKRLKKTVEAQKYTTAELATITNADGVFLNMALRRVNWRRSARAPQEILVSMTWESLNFSGTVENPFFTVGGLTG